MSGSKRRKLTHTSSDNDDQLRASSKTAQKAFFKNAAGWDLEQEYESKQRKGKKRKSEKESSRLPIKTADGRLEAFKALDQDEALVESDEEWLDGREDEEESDPKPEAEPAKPQKPEQEQILEAQEELAKIATAVNENPEDHVGAFKALAKIGESKITTIQVLALITQMSVYKDVIPGYRIRPAEDGPKEQLSKEVRQLRQYEQALVSGYQGYIKELARCAKLPPTPFFKPLVSVAVTCSCTLVTDVPHFNFRGDLIRILVNKLSRRSVDEEGIKARKALEKLFQDDEEGRASMEAVSLLAKMMKARNYQIHESVVNIFLNLRLLSEFAGKASHDAIDQPAVKPKKKREFRTKRERKAIKEQKSLEKAMSNADALVSHEERERTQSETLKLVFATYFRILKQRTPHLMGAVLEGLAKYAHLINQDFFGDLLEALKDLIRHSDNDNETAEGDGNVGEDDDEESPARNLNREALLCTVTAFALLAGQDAHNSRTELHLDLSYFTSHLFRSLLSLATQSDLESTNPSSISASTESKINVQTTTVLLLRSLTAILLPPYNVRSVPPLRLAAFTKQLMSTALQLPEKSCQGVLALLGDVAHTHGKKVSSLWNTEERKGDGRFNPLSDSIEGTNPFTATVWEGELLRKHYSPKVREGVKMVEKGMSG